MEKTHDSLMEKDKCKHRLSINGFCAKCGLSIFDQTHDSLREEILENFDVMFSSGTKNMDGNTVFSWRYMPVSQERIPDNDEAKLYKNLKDFISKKN